MSLVKVRSYWNSNMIGVLIGIKEETQRQEEHDMSTEAETGGCNLKSKTPKMAGCNRKLRKAWNNFYLSALKKATLLTS